MQNAIPLLTLDVTKQATIFKTGAVSEMLDAEQLLSTL